MCEVDTDTFRISNKSLFFLYKQICILSHTFVDLLWFVGIFFVQVCLSDEVGVVEVLINFFEVEELALNVECSHLIL